MLRPGDAKPQVDCLKYAALLGAEQPRSRCNSAFGGGIVLRGGSVRQIPLPDSGIRRL